MKEKSLVKPLPLSGFNREKLVYIPCDTPSQVLFKALQKRIIKTKKQPFGDIHLLKDRIILFRCLGAPAAVLGIERLAASGIREVLLLGFCGSLNPQIKLFEAVCITAAYSEEGTSKHYFPKRTTFQPTQVMKEKMEAALTTLQLPYQNGTIVSTDAPYRETENWLKDKRKRKIDLVDMETSAVFAISSCYNLEVSAIMLVSDLLTSRRHVVGFHRKEMDRQIEEYFFPFLFDIL